MKRTVINRTVIAVAVALSVVVAGIGVADLWLDRNSSGVDSADPAGFVTSPDAAVLVLPIPERPPKPETVGGLIQGLVDAVDAQAHQKHASTRERVVPDGAGTRRWN